MISQSDKKRFRAIAHKLKPVVTVAGNGLSTGVMAELNRALNDHELIKIRLVAEREERRELATAIVDATGAELVASIGGVIVLFKASEKPNPALSNILRSDLLS